MYPLFVLTFVSDTKNETVDTLPMLINLEVKGLSKEIGYSNFLQYWSRMKNDINLINSKIANVIK